MTFLVIYDLVKRLFFPVILPVVLSVGFYLRGRSDGYEKARAENQKAQMEVAGSLRNAEKKNEVIRHEEEKERVKISASDLSSVICLFNAYFGGPSRNCYPVKTRSSAD